MISKKHFRIIFVIPPSERSTTSQFCISELPLQACLQKLQWRGLIFIWHPLGFMAYFLAQQHRWWIYIYKKNHMKGLYRALTHRFQKCLVYHMNRVNENFHRIIVCLKVENTTVDQYTCIRLHCGILTFQVMTTFIRTFASGYWSSDPLKSSAAEMPVESQSDTITITSNLATSRFHKILRYDVRPFSKLKPWFRTLVYYFSNL